MGRRRVLCTEVEDMFHDGKRGKEMAAALGISINAVYGKLRTLGLSITERDHDLRPGTIRAQPRREKRKRGRPPGHDGTERYRELEEIASQYGSVEIYYYEGEYTAFVGVHEGAPMGDIEAAVDSAMAVASEEDDDFAAQKKRPAI